MNKREVVFLILAGLFIALLMVTTSVMPVEGEKNSVDQEFHREMIQESCERICQN